MKTSFFFVIHSLVSCTMKLLFISAAIASLLFQATAQPVKRQETPNAKVEEISADQSRAPLPPFPANPPLPPFPGYPGSSAPLPPFPANPPLPPFPMTFEEQDLENVHYVPFVYTGSFAPFQVNQPLPPFPANPPLPPFPGFPGSTVPLPPFPANPPFPPFPGYPGSTVPLPPFPANPPLPPFPGSFQTADLISPSPVVQEE
ncbi:hypothetical protein BDF14DRAFT_95660 [Spinellus fusiger]|nr:hypothetical protein BDF14DRAFT_95660 [Spinellus fusiger]